MIKIEDLRMEFDGGVVALDNINMEIRDSEFIALLGPSGCGKSTTLNCIAGLLDATAGKIIAKERDITNLQPKDRNIGMVFQSYALYPHLRVIDNIAFPLKQKKVSKEERHEKAREMAKKLQIEHLLDRKPTQLSGGQQQRVAMCRAMVKEPEILLFDEPMSNLDARLKIEIREVIKKLQAESKITSIIVTHDQEEAMAIADRIAILDNGQIQQFDTPFELYQHPVNLFVANFMGNPPMNFIQAKVAGSENSLVFEVSGQTVMVPDSAATCLGDHIGKQVTIGVRSHQIRISKAGTEDSLLTSVKMVENLGKELLVQGQIGNDFLRISVDETEQYEWFKTLAAAGDNIGLAFTDNINIFDVETGNNLMIHSVR
ncbi:ABC transporter ATP-binding protein [Lachnospiraceae bacterium OttesenSCG-928-D06]|nr:ABC transporter ATP-binding protein [Lachnospiraceae bacterium OttesenSCG-928-D06]